jgi:hypothetical protein
MRSVKGVVETFALSSASSTPNKDKCPVDEIKDPTPCTLVYIKGRISRTIKVVKAIAMPSRILYCRSIPVECAVVEVTTIRDGHEFEDLDYPNEEEGIEKLVDAKGTFILWLAKILLSKHVHRRLFRHRAVGGTPTSNMSMPAQDPPRVTPTPQDQ